MNQKQLSQITYFQEQNIKTVGLMIRSEAPIEDSARSLMALLDNLIDDLNKDLLDLPTNYTNLDEKMYRLRYDDMVIGDKHIMIISSI